MPVNAAQNFKADLKTIQDARQKKDHIVPHDEPELDHAALERKAEDLRKRVQTFASTRSNKNDDELVEIKYAKTLEEV